jgi:hypothetical protein
MSNRAERQAEDAYERENDADAPISGDYYDNSYAYESGEGGKFSMGVPVQRDEEDYEDPMQPPFSNTQEQLGIPPLLIFLFPVLCLDGGRLGKG